MCHLLCEEQKEICVTYARTFNRGLKNTQNSFQRESWVMRCGFMGTMQKPWIFNITTISAKSWDALAVFQTVV
jgi:hypothetical protein